MLNGESLKAGAEGVNEFDMQTEARQKQRERKTVLQFALSISAFPVISSSMSNGFFFISICDVDKSLKSIEHEKKPLKA